MADDANRIGLHSIRSLLTPTDPFDLDIAGTNVHCTTAAQPNEPWPTKPLPGISATDDGLWPASIAVACAWEGGRCTFDVTARAEQKKRDIAVAVFLRPNGRLIVWTNVGRRIKAASGAAASIPASGFVVRRKSASNTADVQDRLNGALAELIAASGLPRKRGLRQITAFDIGLPGGDVLPTPGVALRRLIHLALIKLDFLSRGSEATARGKLLVDIAARSGLSSAALESMPPPPNELEDEDGDDDDDGDVAGEDAGGDLPLNLILYGPPGTGKTYTLQSEYSARFTRGQSELRPADTAAAIVDELTYFETFVAALYSMPGRRASVAELLEHPLIKAKNQANAPKSMRQIVWGTLGHHSVEESTTVHQKRRLGELVFDKDEKGRWFFPKPLPPELLEMAELATKTRAAPTFSKDYELVTFHQAYSYEDFIEGIRPRLGGSQLEDDDDVVSYALEDGVFKRACVAALRLAGLTGSIDEVCRMTPAARKRAFEDKPRFAVFIDEINRGNVARVLGELITLLEDDKRLGCESELIVQLPYSKTLFGVPPNLHVIGTMNTADRSVEALDAALRRRFEFREMPPLPKKLETVIEGIDLYRMLATINRRLERLRDRDHCIGHAYFMSLAKTPTLPALQHVFSAKIVPLLQEYFFGDWGKIGLVLGSDFVRRRDEKALEFATFEHEERDALMARAIYELVPIDTIEAAGFRRIYEHVPAHA